VQIGSDILLPVSAPDDDGRPLHVLKNRRDGTAVPILSYSPESGIGRIVREVGAFSLGRLRTRVVLTAHLATVIRNMAASGSGIAWLPQTLIADDLRSGSLVEAASGDWRIPMEVRLYRQRGHIGKVGEDLWAAVLASAATS
jgi:DNA-binding transcriptional LysR family regulator